MTALPRLMLIADGFAGGGARHAARVADAVLAAVAAGRLAVQLRDHGADAAAFAEAARALTDRVRREAPGTLVFVNTRAEVARALGAGLHVGHRGPGLAEHGGLRPLTAAAHSVAEARAAQGSDALLFSPIFPTTSKPGAAPVGLDALGAVCRAVPVPVYALGGITPDRVPLCLGAGAHGVAVLSGLLDAPDPAAAAHAYLSALADAPR